MEPDAEDSLESITVTMEIAQRGQAATVRRHPGPELPRRGGPSPTTSSEVDHVQFTDAIRQLTGQAPTTEDGVLVLERAYGQIPCNPATWGLVYTRCHRDLRWLGLLQKLTGELKARTVRELRTDQLPDDATQWRLWCPQANCMFDIPEASGIGPPIRFDSQQAAEAIARYLTIPTSGLQLQPVCCRRRSATVFASFRDGRPDISVEVPAEYSNEWVSFLSDNQLATVVATRNPIVDAWLPAGDHVTRSTERVISLRDGE